MRNKNAAIINNNTFESWTNLNSWALGFFVADGSIGTATRPHEFKVYNTDIELLEAFKKVFESDKKVFVNQYAKGRLGKKPVGSLFLSSRTIIDFFKSINAYGDKDNRNPFKNIPDEFKWSFIKGLFDGDGNFYRGQFSIAGRKELIEDVYYWICKQLGKEPNKVYQSSTSDKTFYFQLAKTDTEIVYRLIEKYAAGTYNSKKYKQLEQFYDIGEGLLI